MADRSFDETHAAVLFGKRQGQKCVGACVRRRVGSRWSLELFEFCDNEQYSNFDSFLVQLGASTVFIADDVATSKHESRKIFALLERSGITVQQVKRSASFRKAEVPAALLKLVGSTTHSITVAESERELAYPAIDCLVQRLSLLDDVDAFGTYDFVLSSLEVFMKLDSAAVDALCLLPKPDLPSQYGSVFGVLNRCRTKMGARLLDRWIRQPLIDHIEVNKRLDLVEVLKNSTVNRNRLVDGPLKAVPDVDSVIERILRKRAGLSEVYRLYLFFKTLPNFTSVLTELLETTESEQLASVIRGKFIEPLEIISSKLSVYQRLVEHVIDMNKLPDLVVNAAHSQDLQGLKVELDDLEQQAYRVWEDARDSWASFTEVKLERNMQHGYILRTTRGDDERTLRSNNPKVSILSLQKNGVHFTTPKLAQIAGKIVDVEAEYKLQQSALVNQAVETAATYMPVAESASRLIAEIDVLVSFATVAALAPVEYIRPTVLPKGSGVLRLSKARHPCVELMDRIDFIPNDYNFVKGDSHFQIVTGPNMGGKSTYIRAVGSIVTLAQIGSFVPCDSAEISIVDTILARVGAGDAVQKGISTFMAEMLEASVILRTATKDSLIIIDELGRGTSTFDGFGLAWAISDYIINRIGCFSIFATHFHELTSLETQQRGVKNKHVSARIDDKEVIMLYNVVDGPCVESFGINVAEMAGFPADVIHEAKRKILELDSYGARDHDNIKKARDAMGKFQSLPVESFSAEQLQSQLIHIFVPSSGVVDQP